MKGSIGFADAPHGDWTIDVGDVVTVSVELTSEEVRTMNCAETRAAFNKVISEVLRDLPKVNYLKGMLPSAEALESLKDKRLRELLGMAPR